MTASSDSQHRGVLMRTASTAAVAAVAAALVGLVPAAAAPPPDRAAPPPDGASFQPGPLDRGLRSAAPADGPGGVSAPVPCDRLTTLSLPNTTITTAGIVPADATLPATCRVHATVTHP